MIEDLDLFVPVPSVAGGCVSIAGRSCLDGPQPDDERVAVFGHLVIGQYYIQPSAGVLRVNTSQIMDGGIPPNL